VIEIWWERRRGERKKFSGGFLQNENHRRYLIQALVEECKRDGKEYPTVVDFRTTKLAGLFVDYYKNSVFQALTEARFTYPESEYYDPALVVAPWIVLDKLPQGYWDIKSNRKKAMIWLIEQVGDIKKITADSFSDYNLHGLFNKHGSDVLETLKDANRNLTELDVRKKPQGYWQDENKIRENLDALANKLGYFPSSTDIRRRSRERSLKTSVYHYHGGLDRFRQEYEQRGTLLPI